MTSFSLNTILRCPSCACSVEAMGATIVCSGTSCGRSFPVVDGIPRLLDDAHLGANPDTRAAMTYYDELATEFTELDTYWDNPYDRATWEMENHLVSAFLAREGALLDLGTGFYPHIESTVGRDLVCADVSLTSLQVARRMYHTQNDCMKYVCCDVLALPFSSGAFSGIIAGGEIVNHVSAKRLLLEARRVLIPGGAVILSVGMKWCLDSVWSLADAFIGHRIGYSMTPTEARSFVLHPRASSPVTWEVTPEHDLKVTLYSKSDIVRLVTESGFRILEARSLNLVSGLVPLPFQQDVRERRLARSLASGLLRVDRVFLGRLLGIKWFAGNVYLVLEAS